MRTLRSSPSVSLSRQNGPASQHLQCKFNSCEHELTASVVRSFTIPPPTLTHVEGTPHQDPAVIVCGGEKCKQQKQTAGKRGREAGKLTPPPASVFDDKQAEYSGNPSPFFTPNRDGTLCGELTLLLLDLLPDTPVSVASLFCFLRQLMGMGRSTKQQRAYPVYR